MASDYFTATPEMKAPVDVAAAVGKYSTTHQVQISEATTAASPAAQIEGSPAHYQQKVNSLLHNIMPKFVVLCVFPRARACAPLCFVFFFFWFCAIMFRFIYWFCLLLMYTVIMSGISLSLHFFSTLLSSKNVRELQGVPCIGICPSIQLMCLT